MARHTDAYPGCRVIRSRPLRRSGAIPRKGRIKPKKRSAAEYRRIYGSRERVEFVKSLPCAWCVARGRVRMCGPSENAHVENGGMGRKADHTKIVPLGRHHHEKYDRHMPPFDKPSVRLCVEIMARETERLWQAHQGKGRTK